MMNGEKTDTSRPENSKYTGNLVLFIACLDCNAEFELNADAVVFALAMNLNIFEYIEYIQNSNCRICKPKSLDE